MRLVHFLFVYETVTNLFAFLVIALAKELGVAIAAYSCVLLLRVLIREVELMYINRPLGHGVLTGAIKRNSDIPEGDFRRHLQRFQDEVRFHERHIRVGLH